MDETKDFLKEDGYLAVNDCSGIHKIIFHPNLNVILIFTNSTILTLDINSGVVLQRVTASGECQLPLWNPQLRWWPAKTEKFS